MKKLLIMLCSLTPLLAAFGEERPDIPENLPGRAKEFIRQNFGGTAVSQVTMEEDPADREFTVIFTDGSKVEFDKYGVWTEVNCKYGRVPQNVIPERIREHLSANFPDNYVVRIDQGWRKYEVVLDNRLELQFDKNGRFTRFDD